MKKNKNIFQTLRTIIVIIYAILMLLLIPLFFFNYGGKWIHEVAKKLPLKEMNLQGQ